MKEQSEQRKKREQAIALVAKFFELDAEKLKEVDQHTVIRALTRHGWRWNGKEWHLPQRAWMTDYQKADNRSRQQEQTGESSVKKPQKAEK